MEKRPVLLDYLLIWLPFTCVIWGVIYFRLFSYPAGNWVNAEACLIVGFWLTSLILLLRVSSPQLLFDGLCVYDLERDSCVFHVSEARRSGCFEFTMVKSLVVVSYWFGYVFVEPSSDPGKK